VVEKTQSNNEALSLSKKNINYSEENISPLGG